VARQKKEREVSIVHFSFFDLLFGAFGAFVFLMILQVISTLNLVDVDIQKLVDDTVQEKVVLTKELEKYKETDLSLKNLQQQYSQLMDDQKKIIQEKEQIFDKAANFETQAGSLQRELDSLKKYQTTAQKKGEEINALQEENKKLGASLDKAKRKLSAIKTIPLKIKTTSFPATITEEQVNLALAAEGGSPPYSWRIEGNLPKGLSFNQVTGTISGIVKSAGDYSFKVKVTDARGLSVETKNDISFKVIRKYEEQKKKVSSWFVVMAVVSSLLLAYIIWGKLKTRKYIKKMEAEGWKIQWVK
jgi:regulator of replication initiation timing